MVRRITSNAVVKSSDENEGTGLGDDDDAGVSGSLTSSSSSDDGGPLGQAIDGILLGKTKAKGKGKKAHNAGGTKPSASECVPYVYVLFFNCCLRE